MESATGNDEAMVETSSEEPESEEPESGNGDSDGGVGTDSATVEKKDDDGNPVED